MLYLDSNGAAACMKHPCYNLGPMHVWWPDDGKCYKANGKEQGPCSGWLALYPDKGGYCYAPAGCTPFNVVGTPKLDPGPCEYFSHYRDPKGVCRPKI